MPIDPFGSIMIRASTVPGDDGRQLNIQGRLDEN
jgi:hypothetical protein